MATKRREQRQRRSSAFLRNTEGATAIEYGILMMMIGLAVIGMMTMTDVSSSMSNTFRYLANQMFT